MIGIYYTLNNDGTKVKKISLCDDVFDSREDVHYVEIEVWDALDFTYIDHTETLIQQ